MSLGNRREKRVSDDAALKFCWPVVHRQSFGNQPELLVEIFVDSFFSSLESSVSKLFEYENKLSGT